MNQFWKGFDSSKTAAPVRFKKHVIILFWERGTHRGEKAKEGFKRIAKRYPTVAVKIVNAQKDPTKPLHHKVYTLPTIILLKDGREVDRVLADDGSTLVEKLFRKATT